MRHHDVPVAVIGDNEQLASPAEVMQEHEPYRMVVPVTIDEPAQVRILPSVGGGTVMQFVLAADGAAEHIIPDDPMRRVVRIRTIDNRFIASDSQAGCTATSGGFWTTGLVFEWTAVNGLWLRAGTAGSASTITVISERWTQ